MTRARTNSLLGLTTATALLIGTPIASAQPETAAGGMLTKVSANGIELTKHSKSYRDQVKKLDEKLDNTSIGAIVENAQHHGHSAKATQRGFDWTAGEQEGTTWFPQGITGSSDAHASGTYAHHRIIAVSWYDHEGIPDCPLICGSSKRGVRVSFVNYDNPRKPRFTHVELVVPDGHGSVKPLVHTNSDGEQTSLHAGGIAWVGDYLYVADTNGGIRQFDVRHVWKAEPESSHTKFGVHGKKLQAADYRYAIPQVAMYRNTSKLRFSSISVDHTKGHRALVTSEYDAAHKGGRIVRWPLRGNQLDTTKKTVRPRDAYKVEDRQMQGAVSYRGTFFTTHSNDRERGHWRRMRNDGHTGERGSTPMKPEDVSYNPASNRAWWITEEPNQRHVTYTPKAMG